jgi:hypothetical protein
MKLKRGIGFLPIVQVNIGNNINPPLADKLEEI